MHRTRLRVYVQNDLCVYLHDVPVCTGTTSTCFKHVDVVPVQREEKRREEKRQEKKRKEDGKRRKKRRNRNKGSLSNPIIVCSCFFVNSGQ